MQVAVAGCRLQALGGIQALVIPSHMGNHYLTRYLRYLPLAGAWLPLKQQLAPQKHLQWAGGF